MEDNRRTERPWVEVVRGADDLRAHVEAWDDLSAHVLIPNAFYDSFMLLPAIEHMRGDADLLFALVYESRKAGERRLIGLFPLERRRRFKGLPIAYLRLWEYSHCYLSNPLVHRDRAAKALGAFFDWLEQDERSASLMEFNLIWGEGPLRHALVDLMRERGTLFFTEVQWTRAFFQRRAGADEYLNAALSPAKRRDLNRKQRRLEERGKLEFRRLAPNDDSDSWIEDFLRLEASGWKGKKGTALDSQSDSRAFFRPMARLAFAQNRLLMQGLYLNERPIALRCNFVSGEGSFFLKPAYDETLASFSPGVLVERETIIHLHEHPRVRWMDSCTSPDNALLNSIWLDRRMLESFVIATNRGFGRLTVSCLSGMRWLNRALGRYTPPQHRVDG